MRLFLKKKPHFLKNAGVAAGEELADALLEDLT